MWNQNAIHKFHKRVQTEAETVENFVIDLILMRGCSFKEPDEMIRDKIVFGKNSRKIREKLINKGKDLTLDKAIDIARRCRKEALNPTPEVPQ